MTSPEIVVVGSINLDLSLLVDRFPVAGETVIGRDVLRGGGGKGANQAVAAARLGRRVAMVGRVGADDVGTHLRGLLATEGIDTAQVQITDQTPSGLAVIEVETGGENRIVVISGANESLSVADVDRAADLVAEVPVILAQLEVPLEVIAHLASVPRSGRFVLNPAPAVASLDLSGVDIVVPNRGELALLAGVDEAASIDEVADQVKTLAGDLEAVVVTLGGDGALVVDGIRDGAVTVEHVAPMPVQAVDTTAAGDAFCGGLADALCLGADIGAATHWATKVAAVTVTRRGAQDSLPGRTEVLS